MGFKRPDGKRRPSLSAFKRRWKELNPPDDNGYYTCWLCKKPVHVSKMTLDHVLEAALWPEYAKELSNVRPAHGFCNEQRSTPVSAVKKYSSRYKKHARYTYRKKNSPGRAA